MNQPIESLVVELSTKIDNIEQKVSNAMRGAERAASEGEARIGTIYRNAGLRISFFGESAATAASALAVPLMAAGIAFGALGVKALIAAGSMESTRIAFKSLLGSAEEAESFIQEMADFAAKTPFEFVGLTNAARSFMAFGVEAKNIIPIMTTIGDAVAKAGRGQESINQITYAFTQMMSTGRLNAQDMNMMATAGVEAWSMLAKAMGKSIQEVRAMSEKGQISGAQAVNTILQGMKASSAGMMASMSGTLNQLMSNLKDNMDQTLIAIGDAIERTFGIKGKLGAVIETFTTLKDKIKGAKDLEELFRNLLPPWLINNAYLLAGALVGALTPAVVGLAFAIGGMLGALAPFMLAGAAIAFLAPKIVSDWTPLVNFFTVDVPQAISRLADYFSAIIRTGTASIPYLERVPEPIRGIAEAFGTVVRVMRNDVIPALTTVVAKLGDLKTALDESRLSVVLLIGAFAILAGPAAGGAVIATITLLIAKIAAIGGAISTAIAFFQLLATQGFAALALLIPPAAMLGAAIIAVGALVLGLATNFMGMRDAAIRVVAMVIASFQQLKAGIGASIQAALAQTLRNFADWAVNVADLLGRIPVFGDKVSGLIMGGANAVRAAAEVFGNAAGSTIAAGAAEAAGTMLAAEAMLEKARATNAAVEADEDATQAYDDLTDALQRGAVSEGGGGGVAEVPGGGDGSGGGGGGGGGGAAAKETTDALKGMLPVMEQLGRANAWEVWRASQKALLAESDANLPLVIANFEAIGKNADETSQEILAMQREIRSEQRKTVEQALADINRERKARQDALEALRAGGTAAEAAAILAEAGAANEAAAQQAISLADEVEQEKRRFAEETEREKRRLAEETAQRQAKLDADYVAQKVKDIEFLAQKEFSMSKAAAKLQRDIAAQQMMAGGGPEAVAAAMKDQGLTTRPSTWLSGSSAGLAVETLSTIKLPSFALGGVVPGAMGEPHFAVVHGQERVTPPGADNETNALLGALLEAVREGKIITMDKRVVGGITSSEIMGSSTTRARMGAGAL